MELVRPGIGLIFWMTITFGILLFLLAKFAWKPIMNALREREANIENALAAAQKAKEEMAALTASNEKMLAEARIERDRTLREARETKDAIINEAKTRAGAEADRLIASARQSIQNEKVAAINELKNQVASMSIEIAEKILHHELANDEKQKALMSTLLKDVNLN